MTLKTQNKELYYHKEHYECDFLVKDGLDITAAIQVTLSMKDESTRKQEVRGLTEAMSSHNLDTGVIITENECETITLDDKTIIVRPVHEWLMETPAV